MKVLSPLLPSRTSTRTRQPHLEVSRPTCHMIVKFWCCVIIHMISSWLSYVSRWILYAGLVNMSRDWTWRKWKIVKLKNLAAYIWCALSQGSCYWHELYSGIYLFGCFNGFHVISTFWKHILAKTEESLHQLFSNFM
jgi:hypothetical protein